MHCVYMLVCVYVCLKRADFLLQYTTFVWEFKGTAWCLLCIFPWLAGIARYCHCLSNIWQSLDREICIIYVISSQWQFFSSREMRVMPTKLQNKKLDKIL